MAALEGRRGIVLEPQLYGPGGVFARELGDEAQPEVDTGGHPPRRDPVPIDDDAPRAGRAPYIGKMSVYAQCVVAS